MTNIPIVDRSLKGTPEQIRETALRNVNWTLWKTWKGNQCRIREAMAKPLPGAAGDAFISTEMRVAGRKIFRVFPSHVKALQALNSPILKMAEQAAKSDEKKSVGDFTETECMELCYVFVSEPKELRQKLEKFGVEKLKSEAVEMIDGIWDAAEIQSTCVAAMSQYAKHIQTNVKLIQEAAKDDRFFREVLNNHLTQPASVSSSITSAVTENTFPPTPAT